MNRRKLAFSSATALGALAASGVLFGCTTATPNGVVTAKLDLVKLQAYVSAAATFAAAALGIPLVASAVGPTAVAEVKAAIVNAVTLLTSLQTTYGGVASVSLNTGNVMATAQSILSDLASISPIVQGVLALVAPAVPGLAAAFAAFQIVVASVQTLLAIMPSSVGVADTASAKAGAAIATINTFAIKTTGLR